MSLTSKLQLKEILQTNKLIILLEIMLILTPTYLAVTLGYRPENDFISLGGDLVLLGGPLIYIGLCVTLILFWAAARLRGAAWKTFGIQRPINWIRMIVFSLGSTFLIILALDFLADILYQVLPTAEPPDMSRFAALEGNLPNLILNVLFIWITAGFLEELIWRGYLMNRLRDLFGKTWIASVITAFCSAALFGIVHYYQGPSGMLVTGITGLSFSLAFLVVKRKLWPLVIAHGLINTLSFTLMYFNGT